MDNHVAKHELANTLSLVQEQMRHLATAQQQQSMLTATGAAADGNVEVTVDARGMVIKVDIDESYLDDEEFEELGGYIASAAQAAVRQVEQRSAALFAPMTERRQAILGLGRSLVDVPEFGELLASVSSFGERPPAAGDGVSAEDGDEGSSFPMVRR